MKSKTLAVLFLLLFFMSACLGTNSATQPYLTSTVSPTMPSSQSIEPEITAPVATPMQTQLIHPSATHRLSENLKINWVSGLSGTLWIHRTNRNDLIKANLADMLVSSVSIPSGCDHKIIPHTPELLCNRNEGYSIFNLETGEFEPLPIGQPDWIVFSPNGRYVAYATTNLDTKTVTVDAYDRISKSTNNLTRDCPNEDWRVTFFNVPDGAPALSADGEHLGIMKNTSTGIGIFETIPNSPELTRISNNISADSGGMAWSPNQLSVMFGATDIVQELDDLPNYFYLAEPGTNSSQTELIKSPENGLFAHLLDSFNYPSDSWSNDGNYISVVLQTYDSYQDQVTTSICRVQVFRLDKSCFSPFESEVQFVGSLNWSPDNEYLALIADEFSPVVYLIHPETGESHVLINSGDIDGIFWR